MDGLDDLDMDDDDLDLPMPTLVQKKSTIQTTDLTLNRNISFGPIQSKPLSTGMSPHFIQTRKNLSLRWSYNDENYRKTGGADQAKS